MTDLPMSERAATPSCWRWSTALVIVSLLIVVGIPGVVKPKKTRSASTSRAAPS
jgi:hypothetical protein